jgi:hypothetical protein
MCKAIVRLQDEWILKTYGKLVSYWNLLKSPHVYQYHLCLTVKEQWYIGPSGIIPWLYIKYNQIHHYLIDWFWKTCERKKVVKSRRNGLYRLQPPAIRSPGGDRYEIGLIDRFYIGRAHQ